MPRLVDEETPEDWDGADYAEELYNPELRVAGRVGQGSLDDRVRQEPEFFPDNKSYVPNWDGIATQARYRAEHKCQRCGVLLKDRPELLHVHHLDHNKNNNDDWNLMPLCVQCHADHPNHRHLLDRLAPDDKTLLELRRSVPNPSLKPTPQSGAA